MGVRALGAATPLFADSDWGHMDFDGAWGIVMVTAMFLFWALVILGVIWLVRDLAGARKGAARGGRPPDPLGTLDQRLADGDLSVEEYRERRAALTGNDASDA